MGRGGTPGTVVWGRGGKLNGKGTRTEGTLRGRKVRGSLGGGRRQASGHRAGSGPAVPARERGSPPGLGDTPAGSISAPAARLSPSLDPARRGGWSFCGRRAAGCRGSSRRRVGAGGHGPARTKRCWQMGRFTLPRMRLFHSFIASADGGPAPDRL